MKKTQNFCLFVLLFVSSIAHAQWEKVSGRNTIQHESTSFSKYQAIICSNGDNGLYYTRDNGANWKFLRPDYFKPKDRIKVYASVINDIGIFALITKSYIDKKERVDDSTFLFFTPNFGTTWEKRVINTHTPLQDAGQERVLVQNKNYIYAFVTGADATLYDQTHVVLRYTKKQKTWEDLSAQYPRRPSNFDVTEAAEYVAYYGNDTLAIRYLDGRRIVTTFKKPKFGYQLVGDSLMLRLYADNITNIDDIDPMFSKDFGKTWYRTKNYFPSWKRDHDNPYFFTYKNKLFVATDTKIYFSIDKGLNWTLESVEMQKYAGLGTASAYRNLYFHQDSVLLFNAPKVNSDMIFGYNINTKKVIYYNNDIYINAAHQSTIAQLPNGHLIINHPQSPYLYATSADKGVTWQFTPNYPFYFEKINVNDSLFYARDSYNYEVQYVYDASTNSDRTILAPTMRFINNIQKDTAKFFPNYTDIIRKGDTMIVNNLTRITHFNAGNTTATTITNNNLLYAVKPPFDKWIPIPNTERNGRVYTVLFKNNEVTTCHVFKDTLNVSSGQQYYTQINTFKLDGSYAKPPELMPNDFYLSSWLSPSLWFLSGNGNTVPELFQIDYSTNTRRKFTIPDAGKLMFINYKNEPVSKNLLLAGNNQVYISRDSSKKWSLFSNGIENAGNNYIQSTQQIDEYLFAFTTNGLYRRPLSDINLRSVSGKVFHDINGNKIQDAQEPPLANIKITSKKTGAFAISDTTGFYSLLFDTNSTDTLAASFDNKSAIINPAFYISTKSDTAKNFAVQFMPNIQDLSIDITALMPPRTGFVNTYILNVKNVGSLAKDSKVTLKYDEKQAFVQSSIPLASNANQVLTWNFANFKPNERKRIEIQFKTAQTATIRSEITNIVGIDPIVTDNFKEDNTATLSQIVVGSYDPNDKQVIINNKPNEYNLYPNAEFVYTIRFQNTGNYRADFVRVVDTLSEIFDISTLKFLSASHDYKTSSTKGRVLVFDFNPINLPDSTSNEAKSHGFIKFSIKMKRDVSKLEFIKNTAYIYFDYNPAIITNTVKTQQIIIGIKEQGFIENLQIQPNPAQEQITFSIEDCTNKSMQARIYAIDGRLLLTKSVVGNQLNAMNVSNLGAGVYMLQVQTACKNYTGKFVVEK
jgi:Secretion system C-terminal sorting domain